MTALRCEYLLDAGDGEECGAATSLAISVRHGTCCDWQSWGVCADHVDALREDLRPVFLVSAAYAVGDRVARGAAERAVA